MNRNASLPWNEIESAVFLIGLAIIFWQGWWWPGILVLLAITGLIEGFGKRRLGGEKDSPADDHIETKAESDSAPALSLPDRCPNCGGDINTKNVDDTSGDTNSVNCPYCGTRLAATA